jgi:hypothetical protein
VGLAFLAQRLQRRDRGEDGVAVVRAAAAVELAVLDLRDPGPEVLAPAGHLRLLVEVAVEEHGAGDAVVGRDLDQQDRRAAGELHHLDLHALDREAAAPRLGELHRGVDVPVPRPVLVEVRALRGDGDVLDQLRDDRLVPELSDAHRAAILRLVSRRRCPRRT